jgi:hypothetical protein
LLVQHEDAKRLSAVPSSNDLYPQKEQKAS